MAEIVNDLEHRRRLRNPTAAAALDVGEEVFQGLLEKVGQSPDPTAAALAVLYGFARFVALRGVSEAEIAREIGWRIAADRGQAQPDGPAA